ncbi:MAG: helix-turn-helix transcriptional regulator [Pseudomonadota bacterium]
MNPTPESARYHLSKRLKQELELRNWTQAELARRASQHLPGGDISRDNISNYIREKVLPGPAFLVAIAKALGTTKEDLVPDYDSARSKVFAHAPPTDVKDAGNNNAFLRINRQLPWPVVVDILALINKSDEKERNSDGGA